MEVMSERCVRCGTASAKFEVCVSCRAKIDTFMSGPYRQPIAGDMTGWARFSTPVQVSNYAIATHARLDVPQDEPTQETILPNSVYIKTQGATSGFSHARLDTATNKLFDFDSELNPQPPADTIVALLYEIGNVFPPPLK